MRQHENCKICEGHPMFDLDSKVYVHGEYITKEQILKSQEDAGKYSILKPDYDKLWTEHCQVNEIVEQIEKRIKELRYELDHTNPDYKRSIALQEALQEMVNLIGFEKYEEIKVGKK